MDKLTREVLLASQSMLTQEELNRHMEKRSRDRTEHWTRAERLVRLGIMKLHAAGMGGK